MFKSQDEMERGIAAAFAILERWKLTQAEIEGILGFPFGRQLADWKAGDLASMPADVVRRFGDVVSIYQSLRKLPVGPNWLHRPCSEFGLHTPVERMASGDANDLKAVKDHVSEMVARAKVKV